MLLIGSQAFDFGRESSDIDYIATPEELEFFKYLNKEALVHVKPTKFGEALFIQGSVPVEFDTSETGQELIKLVKKDINYFSHRMINVYNNIPTHIVVPEVLLSIKLSHRFLKNSPHFLKTMGDIWALREAGVTVDHPALQEWQKVRSKETYDYNHPILNQSKGDFFTDNFDYVYDHDTIHEAVKTFDVPAFNLIKKDAAEVYCSKEKFFDVSEEIRLATVLEETYVLALERSQIPHNFEPDRLASFKTALEKVCTSIASGYWREYAWENYFKVLSMYDNDYVDRFHAANAAGVIKPYKEI